MKKRKEEMMMTMIQMKLVMVMMMMKIIRVMKMKSLQKDFLHLIVEDQNNQQQRKRNLMKVRLAAIFC